MVSRPVERLRRLHEIAGGFSMPAPPLHKTSPLGILGIMREGAANQGARRQKVAGFSSGFDTAKPRVLSPLSGCWLSHFEHPLRGLRGDLKTHW